MHTYTHNTFSSHLAATVLGARRLYNKAHVKIAVSEASRWTQERFYGGRYRIIPNGVDVSAARSGPEAGSPTTCGCCSSAAPRTARACRSRCAPSRRCAATGVAARLIVAGATREEVEPYLLDDEGVEVAGRVSDDEKWRLMHESDLLVAPSLGGESFGMVLTEAFASGTPVVASDIAGYRDVVTRRRRRRARPRGRPRRARRGAARAGRRPRAPRAHGRRRAAAAPSASTGRTSPPR